MARQECTVGCRAYSGSARAVRSLHEPFDFPLCHHFAAHLCSQQQAENFLNTSNHFHALEMATFVPISYTYVPTAPRSKSATARRKPAPKQSSILDKLQHIKPSSTSLRTARPAAA